MRTIIVLLFLSLSLASYSQDPEKWQAIEFGSAKDYKEAEPVILECAKFILSVPAEAGDPARRSAMGAIVKWMTNTPDHNFNIDESIAKIMRDNDAVLSIYMAALSQQAIENSQQSKNSATLKLHSFETLLSYCEKSQNKVEMTKELRRAIKAKNKGELKKYLDL